MAFIVFDLALQMPKHLRPLLDQVRHPDRSLADQMQRAGQSTFLNIAEGQSGRGRNELVRFQMDLTECRETRAALKLALARGLRQRIGQRAGRP